MMEGLLLLSVEGLGELPPAPTGCDIWESLEAEKECVAPEILSPDSPCHPDLDGMQESQASEEYVREVEWRQRGRLETLRNPCVAHGHGVYGRCREFGTEMDRWGLAADLVSPETEVVCHLM